MDLMRRNEAVGAYSSDYTGSTVVSLVSSCLTLFSPTSLLNKMVRMYIGLKIMVLENVCWAKKKGKTPIFPANQSCPRYGWW